MAEPHRWKRQQMGHLDDHWSASGRESIHSGHFMVSQFEADAQDDEDNEIPMPDPDAQSILTLIPHNSPSTAHQHRHAADTDELILPVPSRSTNPSNAANSIIDISLAKLFKCMNLAYSQKLTSPKWNRFKGVRLRWKDKIRLNNLIWRCWHMQFMMKKNTLVCQFASPLDVDLHSKPEAVVLEGKYWKRQFDVIKAEYQKWRKFHRTRGLGSGGNSILDTVSEFDVLDWSPITSDSNMVCGMDDYYWTSDTLFSTINNTSFPFPDAREIAKAGIADFIQPSLGPLQPNLDDFMNGIPFQQLLNARLPPVPEEVADDMFAKSDYDYPSIMDGGVSMDMPTGGVVGNQQQQQQRLQTQMAIQQQQQQLVMQQNTMGNPSSTIGYDNKTTLLNAHMMNNNNNNNTNIGTKMYDVPPMCLDPQIANQQQQQQQQQHHQSMNIVSAYSANSIMSTSSNSNASLDTSIAIDHPKKRHLKSGNLAASGSPMVSSGGKPFGRRTSHNYDKTLPTPHQTNIYNQVVAQHSQNQMLQQHAALQPPPQQQQQHNQYHPNAYTNIAMSNQTPIIQTTTNHYMNVPQQQPSMKLTQQQLVNNYQHSQMQHQQNLLSLLQQQSKPNPTTATNPNLLSLLAQKSSHQQQQQQQQNDQQQLSLVVGSMDNLHEATSFKSSSSHQNLAYKPYPTKPNKMSSPSYSQLSPSHSSAQQSQHMLGHNNMLAASSSKEMYRSKSLPLNASLPPVYGTSGLNVFASNNNNNNSKLLAVAPKDGPFAVPKYQAAKPSRNRSNSMIAKLGAAQVQMSASLSCATSEPVLSTLAKLLTSSGQQQSTTAPTQQPPSTSGTTPKAFQKSTSVHNLAADSTGSPQPYQSPDSSPSTPLKHNTSSPSLSPLPASNEPTPPPPPVLPAANVPQHPPGTGITTSPFPKAHSSASSISIESTQRRVGHIHAEQKRRYNIKNGFDMLHSLIPQLHQNPNAKLSKAAMLQKGAEYIRQLRAERAVVNEKMEVLKRERDSLNNSINHLHSVLPANGAPVARQKSGRVKELYNEYVHYRTRENWKFWILGLIFKPLFDSFNTAVSVASMEELSRTAILWVDQHCSLMEMRPAVSNQLRYLSTTTDILSDPPSSLQDEVLKAIS